MSVRFERDYSQELKNVKIAMNKSLLKEFKKDNERVVYLENNDEFQIQIFNNLDTEIGAKIFLNNELIGDSYLVIRPGERVWLDRYLDKARKFKFSTYEVNGNNWQVQNAIKHNGEVKVQLYKRNRNVYYSTYSTYGTVLPISNDILYSSTSTPVTIGACNLAATTLSCNSNSITRLKSIETGRISEGNRSNQQFENVDMTFDLLPFSTETIHILPKSTKPVYSDDLQKVYCHNCGRKIKPKFKYCPFCGEKI